MYCMFYYIKRVIYILIIVEATAEQVPQQPNDLSPKVSSDFLESLLLHLTANELQPTKLQKCLMLNNKCY